MPREKNDSFELIEVIDIVKRCERDFYNLMSAGAKIPDKQYRQITETEGAMREIRKALWKEYLRQGAPIPDEVHPAILNPNDELV